MKTRRLRAIGTGVSRRRATGNRPTEPRAWFMGPVSLFIAVMTLFCLICLVYLWEDSQITTANAKIAQLLQVRANVEQVQQTLSLEALTLQSQQRIQIEAIQQDHMQLAQDDQVQWISADVVAPALAAASEQSAAAHPSLAATGRPGGNAATRAHDVPTAWWQAASHALAALFR